MRTAPNKKDFKITRSKLLLVADLIFIMNYSE